MSVYYIVDDGTDRPWIYDLDGGDFDKYGLGIPDWLADEIKELVSDWRSGKGINPDEDKIFIYEFDEDDVDKYNLHIINKFFNDYKFAEELERGHELKDWLLDRELCPEQWMIYGSELLSFIKDNCSGAVFWLKHIPGIKINEEWQGDDDDIDDNFEREPED